MTRLVVKLLLLDENDRVLLIHAKDPKNHAECWYPVGGGVEPNESLQAAAERETYEETGLRNLPTGIHVWTRGHTYEFNGQSIDVHEEWLLHRVAHFTPAPANLSEYETTPSSASAGGPPRNSSPQRRPSTRPNSASY